MPTVHDLADALAPALDRARYHRDGDPAGVWLASSRDVRRLGLRLDAGRPPYAWADGLDAVLIHRPFGLWPARLPAGVGVLAAHRALDDRLSVGTDPALLDALGLVPDGEPLTRDGTPVGRVGRRRQSLADAVAAVVAALGGVEEAIGPEPDGVEAVALAGAMTAELVETAAAHGAGLYVTGQIRGPARATVQACGLRAVAVGQDRAEAWGLRRLGRLVQERWPGVEVVEIDLPATGQADSA
ncbi:Nif3-like dinuclear metal center hexameric protein [Rubrivirga sp.]|uniref:Nif3-like dinuclear metal center hexameric protein n=1 Tax=Rubrivirga sp. TaxID=1885344 RepID=UPI003B527C18